MKKYFDKFITGESFERWLEKVKDYRLGRKLNFQVHHIIPINLLENNAELQRILHKFGFDFNGVDNAIPLQKKSLLWNQNGHANHPEYDRLIEREINNITARKNLTDLEKFELIQKRINDMKNKLEAEVLLGNKNVNDIISW